MKKVLILLSFFSFFTLSAQMLKYHRVSIDLGKTSREEILEAGITIDHSYTHNNSIETEISELEVNYLDARKIPYKVLIYDMAKYYASRNAARANISRRTAANGCNDPIVTVPSHFHLGSMGGYFTLDEMEEILDSMALLYPNLVKAKAPTSTVTTHEGRNQWYVKISDNPNVDENEPEVLYTSLHHAREGASLSQLIFYMWYLLENYNTDPHVKAVLNNTELYFVPCVNPDGYKYNESTDPNGGGMWRKNRRDNGDGSYGVDLNRNYGVNWGYDNSGSSPMTGSDVYRGTGPFSEPETQSLKMFCESRNFKNALNAHTFSNVFIYPWGHVPDLQTDDSTTFKKWGALLTKDSRFHFGTCNQTLNYETNGGADDWMYGEQTTKSKIFSMTPESGSYWDGFWPVSGRIIDICKVTFSQNLNLALLTLNYVDLTDRQDKFLPSSGYLKYSVTPIGLSPGTFTVRITQVGAVFSAVGSSKIYTAVPTHSTLTDSIAFTLSTTVLNSQKVQYKLTIDDGLNTREQLVTKVYGSPVTLLYDDCTTAAPLDILSQWGTSIKHYVSPPSSITDSELGNYQAADTKMLATDEIDLNDALYVHLQYYTRYVIEKTFDQVKVSVSTDNGVNYTPLCAKYSTPLSSFDGTEPLYDGRQEDWALEDIDLSAYIGKKIRIRFDLLADNYNEKDGFYLDDLLIRKISKTVSGVSDIYDEEQFTIVPNPSSGIFSIRGIKTADVRVIVYNSLGQIVSDDIKPTSIDLSGNSPGVYFVFINGARSNCIKKVVLAR